MYNKNKYNEIIWEDSKHTFEEVIKEYSDIQKPEQFDVIFIINMNGNILVVLRSALIGDLDLLLMLIWAVMWSFLKYFIDLK